MGAKKRTFEEWREQVDRELIVRAGCIGDDLLDFDYYNAWSDGVGPKRAAKSVLANARAF